MCDSFFLFAEPSFAEGMARVLDLGNTLSLYNDSHSEAEADSIALNNDWIMVGQDISKAISENREIDLVKEKPKQK